MREILFRGQTRSYGEKVWVNGEKVPSNWVYGGICQGTGAFSIIYGYMDEYRETPIEKHVVYTESIGQYTGLTDKNGKRIFEGDIVDVEYDIQYVGVAAERIGLFVVVFDDGSFMKQKNDGGLFHFIPSDKCEVIGNIYDNPELLKGE